MKNAFAAIATFGLAFVFPMQAQAATDLFLTWPGIIGPSTVQGHAGDIELASYTQTASNTFNQSGSGGGSGKAVWPAPGSEDTELGVLMELEVRHGATEVYP
jgi:hypothetical protein